MISLDQVQLLEKKVATIVAKMTELERQNQILNRQNSELKDKNENLFNQNQALMHKISSFEADQSRIEQGILSALDKLNSMESSANSAVSMTSESHHVAANPEPSVETIAHTESSEENKTNETEVSVENTEKTEVSENKDTEDDDDAFKFGLDLNFDDIDASSENHNQSKPDIF
ncbi:MAG: cell division protein ZapB [Treponemataceae bacterium]|nr:cell division protein ZapB [Treponemataceae bacterium]